MNRKTYIRLLGKLARQNCAYRCATAKSKITRKNVIMELHQTLLFANKNHRMIPNSIGYVIAQNICLNYGLDYSKKSHRWLKRCGYYFRQQLGDLSYIYNYLDLPYEMPSL